MANRGQDTARGQQKDTARAIPKSDFPKDTLKSALRLITTIEEVNAGQPYPPTDTAIALNVSPGSSSYRILLSSALRYGLTTGTYKSDYITLTALGRAIAAPSSPEERDLAVLDAAMKPSTLKAIYEYYKNKKLPEQQFFENTVVREFGVPKEHAKKCFSVFVSNMELVGLLRKASTGTWVGVSPVTGSHKPEERLEEDENEEPTTQVDEDSMPGTGNTASPEPIRNAIFIGHGKNRKPLDQLKKIFDQFSIPYKVAVEEANEARPISEKVAETMAECGAAILIFTADEEFRDLEGNAVWRPSENVVYELGAASIKYGGRIIIFKEEGVVLPTNFRDIGHISFEKDKLEAKMSDLFKELIAFKLVRMVIGQ